MERFTKLLILAEIGVCILLILFEPTYVFDWDAYMEEVAGVVRHGELDYSKLHGDTGPLVYPGGFVWLFSFFYYLTWWDEEKFTTEYIPKNISGYEQRDYRPPYRMVAIQVLYSIVYISTRMLVLRLASKIKVRGKVMPKWALVLFCISRRLHSIFVLGFFNDCFATLFLLVAINYFVDERWSRGCVFFSVAVSIKMNVLLFAPGLLVLLLQRFGTHGAVRKILLCAAVQAVAGLPFLLTHPIQYIAGAFNFGRKFDLEWSYNWRFLDEATFRSGKFAVLLLAAQVATCYCFAVTRWSGMTAAIRDGPRVVLRHRYERLTAPHVLFVLCSANFIGILFCRSLHYQFFAWYAQTLPLLLWMTRIPNWAKVAIIIGTEVAWNQHPPVAWSALLLQFCHVATIVALWRAPRRACGVKKYP